MSEFFADYPFWGTLFTLFIFVMSAILIVVLDAHYKMKSSREEIWGMLSVFMGVAFLFFASVFNIPIYGLYFDPFDVDITMRMSIIAIAVGISLLFYSKCKKSKYGK